MWLLKSGVTVNFIWSSRSKVVLRTPFDIQSRGAHRDPSSGKKRSPQDDNFSGQQGNRRRMADFRGAQAVF
jgi:hypothetical protein